MSGDRYRAGDACRLFPHGDRSSEARVQVHVTGLLSSDGYLANGAEPWAIPEIKDLPQINVKFATDPATFMPYARDGKHSRARMRFPALRGSNTASVASRSSTSPAT